MVCSGEGPFSCRSILVHRVFLQVTGHNEVDNKGLSRQVDHVDSAWWFFVDMREKEITIVKGKRRSVIIAASLVLGALLFFLPSLLCLQPVLRSTLGFVSRQLPGSLEVQSCSLGWRQGLRCEDLRYQDTASGVQVAALNFSGDKGLFALLVAPRYLGEITIDQPIVTFQAHSMGGEAAKHDEAAAVSPGEPSVSVQDADGSKSLWWERMTFRLKVNKGLVVLDHAQGLKQELAREIDLTSSLAVGTVHYAFAFRSGLAQQEGSLRAEGFINLPTARLSLFDALISRTEVEIKGLEIAAFLDFAASRWNFPRGKGVLDATCRVATAGIDDLEVQGEATLKKIRLAGGFLGQDQPVVDQLLFKFNGSHKGKEGWQLTTLDLASDPMRIVVSGSYDHTMASFAAKGSMNLPVLTAQLPHLLSLHEQTTFQEGVVDFALNVSGTPEEFALQADCRTGHLTVAHKGQFFSWKAPLSLVAEVDRRQRKTVVRTLQAHTPFFDAQGSGGADDFTLRATADLGKMFEELGKIFTLNVQGKGKVAVTGSSKKQDDGRYRLDTRIGIGDFAFSRGGAVFLPPHDSFLTGEAWASSSFFQQGSFDSLQVNGSSWPGNFSISAQKSELANGKLPILCSIKGKMNLERMSSFFYGLIGVTPPCKLKGTFFFDSSGGWANKSLSLATLDGIIEKLAVTGTGYSLYEPLASVSLANKGVAGTHPIAVRELMVSANLQDFIEKERPVIFVDFQRQRLDLRHLTIKAPGTIVQGSLSLGNWWQPQRDFVAEVSGQPHAAVLTALFKAAGWFSGDLAMKGRAQATLKIKPSGEQKILTELALQMEPFELLRGKKKIFGDTRLGLKATLLGGGSEVAVPSFVLQTTPLQVAGTGLVQRSTPASLELQGTLTPDFSFFSDLLVSATGQKVKLAGKQEGVFLLSSPLKQPVALQQITLAARLPVDSFRFKGLELRQFEMPVEINRGKFRAIIAGELSGGRVEMQPQCDFGARRLEVSLPSSSQILQDLPLQQQLIDGVLAPIHPLFGTLAQPEGVIDLRLERFSWPMNAKGMKPPVFKATMGLGKMRLKPIKALLALFDLSGIDYKELHFKEPEVTCEGDASRILCAPLHLLAGESEIGIRGSVGRDRTLDYLVQMPVTEQLAGKVQLPMQQGVSVNVPIIGSQKAPVFDQRAFLVQVTSQLTKAAAESPEQPLKNSP